MQREKVERQTREEMKGLKALLVIKQSVTVHRNLLYNTQEKAEEGKKK